MPHSSDSSDSSFSRSPPPGKQDSSDDVRKVQRREKNRIAAQKSRQRQTQKADTLHLAYLGDVAGSVPDHCNKASAGPDHVPLKDRLRDSLNPEDPEGEGIQDPTQHRTALPTIPPCGLHEMWW
ncbi:basic leucine zipper transcriptional factor ATF-like isoform 2-T2 [Hipposideros larvatus]